MKNGTPFLHGLGKSFQLLPNEEAGLPVGGFTDAPQGLGFLVMFGGMGIANLAEWSGGNGVIHWECWTLAPLVPCRSEHSCLSDALNFLARVAEKDLNGS